MSSFTLPLKRVIEITGGTIALDSDGISRLTGGNIGLDYYPIYEDSYRPILTGKIVDHFFNREIGWETIDLFQLGMRRRMNEIMPYYNQLYQSTLLGINALSTVDLHTSSTGSDTTHSNQTAESDTTGEASGSSRTASSDTPQNMLSGNEDYATNAVDANSQSTNTANNTQSNTGDQDTNSTNETDITGYQGAASDLLIRFRESIINVDLMILNELEDQFMLVWDNGDEYTRGTLL